MISFQSDLDASVGARATGLEVLAVLPATAHLTSKEAALYINTTPEVLRVWRSQGKGPRFKGRGHFVRYVKSDLDAFMSGFDHRFVEEAIDENL
jgi:Helix-turn-helix domain